MGYKRDGSWSMDTLGDVIDSGSSLRATCGNDMECGRTLDLDVYDLAMQFGRRWPHYDSKLPIKCAHCGSRTIRWIAASDNRTLNDEARKQMPPGNFRESRSQEERDALALLFPRLWEWPARGDP